MRRYLLTVAAAGWIGIGASPAFATGVTDGEEVESAAVAVHQVVGESTGLRDEAMMVLVGSALIGLAAAVRRTA